MQNLPEAHNFMKVTGFLIIFNLNGLGATGNSGTIALGLTDGSNNVLYYSDALLGYQIGNTVSSGEGNGIYLHSPATTSSTTYKIQVRTGTGGTLYWNSQPSSGGTNADFGWYASTITVMEIAA